MEEWRDLYVRKSYNMDALNDAIQFISGPEITQKVAHGTHTVHKSDGTPVVLPNNICKVSPAEAYTKYQQHHSDSPHPLLSKTQVLQLVALICPGQTKCVAALDGVSVKCGTDNFNNAKLFVDSITIDRGDLNQHLKHKIDDVQHHMKHILPTHLSEHTQCKYHSYPHLLDPPDPVEEGAVVVPDNDIQQSVFCASCGGINAMLEELTRAVDSMRFPAGPPHMATAESVLQEPEGCTNGKSEFKDYLENTIKRNVLTYYKHILRTTCDANTPQWLIDHLLEDEALLIEDFKMKLLPLFFREATQDFYSKRGIPWLGLMFIRRKTADEKAAGRLKRDNSKRKKVVMYEVGEYVAEIYDAVMDDVKENGHTAFSATQAITQMFKHNNPHITKMKIMTDGAGCFQGKHFFLYLPLLGRLAGIRVTDHYLSETGQGKTILDGHFSRVKQNLWRSVRLGAGDCDVRNAACAVVAASRAGGIAGTKTFELKINTTNDECDESKMTINKLCFQNTKFMHRHYNYTNNNTSFEFSEVELRYSSNRKVVVTYKSDKFKKWWKSGDFPGDTGVQIIHHNNTTGIIPKHNPTYYHPDDPAGRPLVVTSAATAAEAVKGLGHMALGSDEKKRKNNEKHKKNENKKQKIVVEKQQKETQHQQKLANSELHHCPECNEVFYHKANLDKHIATGNHYYGSSVIKPQTHKYNKKRDKMWMGKTQPNLPPLQDVIINYIEKDTIRKSAAHDLEMTQINTLNSSNSNTNNNTNNTITLFDNTTYDVPYPEKEFAVKGRGGSIRSTLQQMEFVLAKFLAGDSKKQEKITTDEAHNMMRLVGTRQGQQQYSKHNFMKASDSGYPKFKITLILTKEQIKGYFGQTKQSLKDQVEKLKKAGGVIESRAEE
jgi:uncharacterized C2H2 Zn-finger protein